MNLTKRQEDSTCTLAATEVRDDGLTMHFESEMPNYGTVRFSLRIHSSGERGSGACDGSARGALEDGTYFSAAFQGRWVREGTLVVARYVVEVSNGDLNFDVLTMNGTGKAAVVQHFALN